MQAMCVNRLRIRWASIQFPACLSDYIAWQVSGFPEKIHQENLILCHHAIFRDNTYVLNDHMVTPFCGEITHPQDNFNFINCNYELILNKHLVFLYINGYPQKTSQCIY